MTLLGAWPRRTRTVAVLIGMLMVPTSAAAVPSGSPAPAPATVPTAAAGTLENRYQANRSNIEEAARMAETHGARIRAEALQSMADLRRQFLSFNARGAGRVVEVLGDLARAERISVLVPGADTALDTYDGRGSAWSSSLGGGACALYDEAHGQDPHTQIAVVAWLGYDTPDLVSLDALTTSRAENAGRRAAGPHHDAAANQSAGQDHHPGPLLRRRRRRPCRRRGLAVTDIAVYGSPGLGVPSAADLRTDADRGRRAAATTGAPAFPT